MNERLRDKEFFLKPEHTQVVDNLIGIDNKPVSQEIIDRIVFDERIEYVVVVAEPGSGKTTILQKIAEIASFKSQFNRPIKSKFKYFDGVLAQAEEPTQLGPRSQWTNKEWSEFSNRLYTYITTKDTSSSSNHRVVTFAEIVGIGITDRGVSTLSALAKTPGIYVIGIPQDPRIQERAIYLRGFFLDQIKSSRYIKKPVRPHYVIKDDQVEAALKNHKMFNTVIDWFHAASKSTVAPEPAQAGRIIREHLSRMAPKQGILNVHWEVLKQAYFLIAQEVTSDIVDEDFKKILFDMIMTRLANTGNNEAQQIALEKQIEPLLYEYVAQGLVRILWKESRFDVDPEILVNNTNIGNMHFSDQITYLVKVMHMQHQLCFLESLGLPPENAIVALNLFQEEPIHLQITW